MENDTKKKPVSFAELESYGDEIPEHLSEEVAEFRKQISNLNDTFCSNMKNMVTEISHSINAQMQNMEPQIAKQLEIVNAQIKETFEKAKPAIVMVSVRFCRRRYRKHKNPLFIWEAYQIIREHKLPFPEWMLEYFDECAASLTVIPKDIGKGIDRSITMALGLKGAGKGTMVKRYHDDKRNMDVTSRFMDLVRESPNMNKIDLQLQAMEEIMGELGEEVDVEAIRKWIAEFRPLLEMPVTEI